MGAFYLNSVADKIYLYPQGMVDFRGLGSEVMFFKKALDKLDVDEEARSKGITLECFTRIARSWSDSALSDENGDGTVDVIDVGALMKRLDKNSDSIVDDMELKKIEEYLNSLNQRVLELKKK